MTARKSEFGVIVLWICSASLVCIMRFLNAADLGYDLTSQIQAAQNLLQGKGLAVFHPVEEDFSRPLGLIALTHFPSGYSLSAAALIALGASPGMVVRVIGAVATLLGWWGWGRLSGAYLREGMERGRLWRIGGYSIALLCPLQFTPAWLGTDILLWASVPWVLMWIGRASDEQSAGSLRLDVAAGAVCGVSVLMRYASLFLAAYAGLLILCQCRKQLPRLVKRCLAFGGGFLPALMLQVYVNSFLANASGLPQGMSSGKGLNVILERAYDGFVQLTAANFAFVFWMPRQILDLVAPKAGNAPWALSVTVLFFSIPFLIAWQTRFGAARSLCRDVRITGAALPIWLTFFLFVCHVLGSYGYVGDQRYYWPMVPLAIFGAYLLAASRSDGESMLMRLVRIGAKSYVAAFVLLLLVSATLLLIPGQRGLGRRVNFMGTDQITHWPSLKTGYEFSAARRFVVQFMRENPDTMLLTNYESLFYAERDVDLSRVHRIVPCEWMGKQVTTRYLTGPLRVLIMVGDLGAPTNQFAWNFFDGTARRAECYEKIPNVQPLKQFPDEKINLLQAEVPAGVRITLDERESL